MPSHANGPPTDLAPNRARRSMLRPILAPDRRARGGDRRLRIHCRDQPIEAEHVGLSLKETGLKDSIKRAVPLHQLGRAFWPDSGSAGQFVGGIAAERNKVRHLVWSDAVSLPDLLRPMRAISPPRDG